MDGNRWLAGTQQLLAVIADHDGGSANLAGQLFHRTRALACAHRLPFLAGTTAPVKQAICRTTTAVCGVPGRGCRSGRVWRDVMGEGPAAGAAPGSKGALP